MDKKVRNILERAHLRLLESLEAAGSIPCQDDDLEPELVALEEALNKADSLFGQILDREEAQ